MKKKQRQLKASKIIKDLVPLFFALAISTQAIGIVSQGLSKVFGEEIRIRLLEFKLMNVIEIEKRDKKITIEYRELKGINKYIKNFLKKNPKWKSEKENYHGIITGRIILTRVYRTYHKKRNEEWEEDYDD